MKQYRSIPFLAFLLLTSVSIVLAQTDSCPAFVQSTLDSVVSQCADAGRDEICYGSGNIEAESRSGTLTFAAPGDIVSINDIESLSLSGLNVTDNTWGVALVKVQANILESESENVTIVAFGDVDITNAVPQQSELQATVVTEANVRAQPEPEAAVVGAAVVDLTLTLTGRLPDSSWVRMTSTDARAGSGWVYAPLLSIQGDVSTLPVVAGDAPPYNPLQAFNLVTEDEESPCAEAPSSGVLIQTPSGVGEIEFSVNDVQILLGSTAYLQSTSSTLRVTVVEGNAIVTADGISRGVPAGAFTTVPLSGGSVNGAPAEAAPYVRDNLAALPLSILPETIALADPATADELAEATAATGGVPREGNWSVVSLEEGGYCNYSENGTMQKSVSNAQFLGEGSLTLNDDGASFTYFNANGPTTFTQIEPGVYFLSIRTPANNAGQDDYTIVVNSPTSMTTTVHHTRPGYVCESYDSTATWTYIGE